MGESLLMDAVIQKLSFLHQIGHYNNRRSQNLLRTGNDYYLCIWYFLQCDQSKHSSESPVRLASSTQILIQILQRVHLLTLNRLSDFSVILVPG